MSDLATHIEYDEIGRPVLVVYKKWQSALWTPGRQATACKIPLDDIWQIEGFTKDDVKRLNLDPMQKYKCMSFGQKVKEMLEMFGLSLGKKPNETVARYVVWLMDRAAEVMQAKNVAPEPQKKKEIGSVEVMVDGVVKRTDPLLVNA